MAAVNKIKVIISIGMFVIVALAALAAYTWIALNWSYSKGERAGYIQKFSQKGWICKTWEGELQVMPVPGTSPEKFLFSVRGDDIAQKLNNAMGKKVSLSYEQHVGVPSKCFAETEYFVTGIKILE
jgi:hypothetical protein